MEQFVLNSNDDLTIDLLEAGIVTWDDIVRSVQCFHYSRNVKRNQLDLVWYERKGTCSSKHAFLKQIADLNDIPNVELILSFYKMDKKNTPAIGSILEKNNLNYIPEAHCYLKVNELELDITKVGSDFNQYKNDIMETKVINPNDVVSNKIEWHKEYLNDWINNEKLNVSLDKIWSIREECIAELEKR